MKLNLGAGQFKKENYVNIDWDTNARPDVLWDLNKFPYPFKDESVDLVEADYVLEHLENPFKVMKELHRILRFQGILIIKLPHFSRGFTHPEHKRGFDVSFHLYFNKDFKGGYQGVEFKLIEMRFKWFTQSYLKKITLTRFQYYGGKFLGYVFDFFANMSPYFCSKIWCYWVGGFEGIKFVFEKN